MNSSKVSASRNGDLAPSVVGADGDQDGIPTVILEAMALGLPVITTPNSGSIVRDGKEGFVVPIRDVEALRERIAHLRENPGVRARMGHAARARAEQYTWDHSRRRLLPAYEEAMAGG